MACAVAALGYDYDDDDVVFYEQGVMHRGHLAFSAAISEMMCVKPL